MVMTIEFTHKHIPRERNIREPELRALGLSRTQIQLTEEIVDYIELYLHFNRLHYYFAFN